MEDLLVRFVPPRISSPGSDPSTVAGGLKTVAPRLGFGTVPVGTIRV
ncbi:MAG TPA: hypothetical protein VHS36_05270 [Candidatus Limnocylindrales bacterium]|nr:hypothetical protein [Candidatus Limnocylindrales bacterium]